MNLFIRSSDISSLVNPAQISAAISADGLVLGEIGTENRICTNSGSIHPTLEAAILSAEDKRFFIHNGVDWRGVARACWKNIRAGRIVQGGSTITQQLVRNALLRTTRKTLGRKITEAFLALVLEKHLSKNEILSAYLNMVYFGHGIYGIRLASLYYLSKEIEELTVDDCAYLAGLLKGPRHFCRCCNQERAFIRTRYVLQRMIHNGHNTTTSPRNRRRFKQRKTINALLPRTTPYFSDFVRQWLLHCTKDYFPAQRLIVRTSLNLRCQEALEKVCRDIEQEGFKGRLACIIQDAQNGLVRAIAGGYNYQTQPFNVAVNGRLQPGSTFKPFILAAALKAGISPDHRYVSKPLELKLSNRQIWRVGNYQRIYRGEISIADATIFSDNSVFAQLMLDLDEISVKSLLSLVGLDVGPVSPAAAIGAITHGCSPLQVCASYSIFSTGGLFFTPTPVLSVHSESGTEITSHADTFHPVLSPNTAKTINAILRQVVIRGTGPLAVEGADIYAKTGTTHDGAWYASYDQAFRVLTWVEHIDEEQAPNYPEKAVTARNIAQRIWSLLRRGQYMSTDLYGIFRGTDRLNVRDLLWIEEQFA